MITNEIELRKLVIRSFHVNKAEIAEKTKINDNCLSFSLSKIDNIITKYPSIKEISVKIIKPNEHNIWTNSIMDILPISVKVLGNLGEGITHTITGAYVMMTGVDEAGTQIAEFGSSEGILAERLKLGRPGTPSENDYIISFDIVVKEGKGVIRETIVECHKACDDFLNDIRLVLKSIDGKLCTEKYKFYDKIRKNGYKVAIVKQVAGQGAMYDNFILPNNSSSVSGARSIIDMGNVPIILSPNEYRDGAIRAMT
ncbi:proline reductase cluster protein PrdD [Acetoanaerobium noterae]|uniref:proline reductase cluster protein PrdD n=1 Tax=Acetoanaerobium noterae TaxID=745369 RepID=UPI00332902A4